ncbi:unnamed protein product [Malus baccata var. baccata]
MMMVSETSSFLQPLAFTLLPIFLILLYRWYSSATTTNKTPSPPSPPKLPFIGNLHQVGLHPHRSFQALSQRHGPLMLLHFGSVPVLVVSSAEAAREIMKAHDLTFSNRPKSTIVEKLLYNYNDVTFAPYGEYWRQVKSICVLNLLTNKRVRSFRSVREEETISMMRNIKQSSSSLQNLSEIFVRLTNDVVCRVALGRTHNGGEGGRMFTELLEEFMELLGIIDMGDYIPWLSWVRHVNGLVAKVDKVAKQFDDFIVGVIQEHMKCSSKSEDDDKNDFVDVLLAVQKENLSGIPIDTVTIKALILDMFAAGTDTSSTFLEWAMTELLRHPRTQVMINAWHIGRDPKVYDKPEDFEPERFLNSEIDYKGTDFQLIPFGAGRRMCPGIPFAMAINEIALASVVHKYDWELPSGASGQDLDMTESTGLSIQQQQQQQSLFPLSGVGYMNPRTPLRSVLCHILR